MTSIHSHQVPQGQPQQSGPDKRDTLCALDCGDDIDENVSELSIKISIEHTPLWSRPVACQEHPLHWHSREGLEGWPCPLPRFVVDCSCRIHVKQWNVLSIVVGDEQWPNQFGEAR